jgi:transcriptional regulator
MSETETTTILIKKSTRNKLKVLGNKGDTYDDIIEKLIESKENSGL